MRAIWNGVVSFGLVSVPVRLYAATANHDIRFHQVHAADGGQIRYRRVCEVCGREVAYEDLAKGYTTEDGELVTLDADDMSSLPLSSSREIEVVEFVPAEQVDSVLLDRSYYLEPDVRALKPYALLREALHRAERMAVVKVALRQRETLALLRVRGDVIVLQTMLWPDEVREPDFEVLDTAVQLRPQELRMASMLVESLASEFEPARFDDRYKRAVEELIEFKREHGGARPAPIAATADGEPITDLLTALKRSVEEARSSRSARGPAGPAGAAGAAGAAEVSSAAEVTDPGDPVDPADPGEAAPEVPAAAVPAQRTKGGAKAAKGRGAAKKDQAGPKDPDPVPARKSGGRSRRGA